MHHALPTCLALLASSSLAGRQSRPASQPLTLETLAARVAAEVRAGLRSNDDRQLAWAAWHTRSMRLSALASETESALVRLSARPAGPERWMAATVLCDALISLRARVAPARLREWWTTGLVDREALLVLAAVHPHGHTELLAEIAESTEASPVWLCACNLLLETAPRRLVTILLKDLVLDVQVAATITSTEAEEWSAGSDTIACGRTNAPDGFPPILTYVLDLVSVADAEQVLTRGPQPIGWQTHDWNHLGMHCERTTVYARRAHALSCLLHLGGPLPACPDLARVTEFSPWFERQLRWNIGWREAASWKKDCGERLGTLRRQWALLIEALQTKGLLADAALARRDVFRVQVLDERADRTTPLPRIE